MKMADISTVGLLKRLTKTYNYYGVELTLPNEIFDIMYIACDHDGRIWGYYEKPTADLEFGCWRNCVGSEAIFIAFVDVKCESIEDWADSLKLI